MAEAAWRREGRRRAMKMRGRSGIVVAVTALAILWMAGSEATRKKESYFLTKEQKKEALLQIDSICGDTWCEGDFGFKFNWIDCDFRKRRCKVGFDLYNPEEENRRAKVVCTIGGLKGYPDVIKTVGTRYSSLNDRFYTKLTSCISGHEKRLYDKIFK